MIECPGAPVAVATQPGGAGSSAAGLVRVGRQTGADDERSVQEEKNKAGDDDDGPSFIIKARILLATLVMFLTAALFVFGLKGRGLFHASTTTTPEPQLNLDRNS
ncbi:hypothetical protein MRX96_026293 [Rhipicephalus microplus]